VAPTPNDLVEWMRVNMKVSYYEPLSQWAVTFSEPDESVEPKGYKSQDWNAEAYGMSFNLVAKSGGDMGLAVLEFTPPLTKTIKQVVELCDMDMGANQPTSVEKKYEVMF
jgi:hypothetical protein